MATPSVKASLSAAESSAAEEVQQFLTFSVSSELYAVGILAIKEIIQYATPTQVPMMPPYVTGVINLRGAVVPVIDLKAKFHQTRATPGRRSCIVILEVDSEGASQVIGLMVDSVSAVLDIPPSEIEPAPRFGVGIRTEFISGMAKLDGRFVIVLDVNRTFDLTELAEVSGSAESNQLEALAA